MPKPQESSEGLAPLRQTIQSLALRGRYRECVSLIEQNLSALYFEERRPAHFYEMLRLHKRCYPSLNKQTPYQEYLAALLNKRKIPVVFARLLKQEVSWTTGFFREEALRLREEGDLDGALGCADLMIKLDPLDSNAHLVRGWMLRDLERDGDAIASFARAVELERGNLTAVADLAALRAKSDPQGALEVLEQALPHRPDAGDLRGKQAEILLGLGRPHEALACYEEATTRDPLNAELLLGKAALLEQMPGQELAAIRQYQRILALKEGFLPARRGLGFLLRNTQPEQAIGHLRAVVEGSPKDRAAGLLLAQLLEQTGNAPAAVAGYGAYLALDPDAHAIHAAVGNLLRQTDPARALSHYETACDLAPNRAEYHLGRGDCAKALGRLEEAAAAYREAIRRDSSNAAAHAALGELLAEDDPRAALGFLEAALRLSPENACYHRRKGEMLGRIPGTKPQALIDCYDRAVRLAPEDASLRITLARLLEEEDRVASAVEHYRAAVNLDPAREDAHFALAHLLLDSEPQTALLHINRAIEQGAGNPEYDFQKALIYRSLGDRPDLAREAVTDEHNIDAAQELRQLLDGDTPRVAMMYCNRALERKPREPRYLCERAELLVLLGQTREALRQFEFALEQEEACDRAHLGIARLCGDSARAMRHIDRAIALAPGKARPWAEKALLLARDARSYPEALACFEEALARDTAMPDVMLEKARLLEAHGEVFSALESYRRVLLIDRTHLEARVRMAALLCPLHPRAALRYIDEAVAADPGDYRHFIWRGRILHELGENREGEASIQQAIELGGEREEVYQSLAHVLHERLPDVALRYSAKAMRIAPQNPAHPLLQGKIYGARGELLLARQRFEEALRLDPACHEALAALAELLLEEENPEALALIDRALELGGTAQEWALRGRILGALAGDWLGGIRSLEEAVRLAPAELRYREELLAQRKQAGQRLRYWREIQTVKRLRRALQEAEQRARAEES